MIVWGAERVEGLDLHEWNGRRWVRTERCGVRIGFQGLFLG